MSNTQFAFISRDLVPHRAALQASIDSLGFDLQLDPDYTPFKDSGFSPCVLSGREGFGFEIYYSNSQEHDEAFRSIAAGRDHCISMVWHSSMNDMACAMIVSCALAKDFDAMISYEGEPLVSLDEMIRVANEVIEQGQVEPAPLAQQETRAVQTQKPWWKWW